MIDASERKVLVVTVFVAGCISLAPQEWTSAGMLLVGSALLFVWDRRLAAREEAAAKASKPTVAAPAPASPSEEAPPAEETAAGEEASAGEEAATSEDAAVSEEAGPEASRDEPAA